MNKEIIKVPEGIRFLSDWESFNFSSFPEKCIINKQIPGCGFTEYCIRSNENIILCSPRKILLKNKYDQHKDEVYLVVNEMDKDPGVDKDIDKLKRDLSKSVYKMKEEIERERDEENKRNSQIYERLAAGIGNYILHCTTNNIPAKILVTYDSYRIVQQILMNLGVFETFYTVIDEFQSILHDARFKSDTELKFMNYLKRSHSAIFVSATPMMDEYLDMLSEFKDLSYFELDWYTQDHSRVIKPNLKVLTMKSVGTKAEEIIETYLKGEFEKVVVMRDNIPVEITSTEAVFYVNSVNHIISIIKKTGLKPEQVNILCADTEENRKKIKRRLGREFDIGSVPLRGEVWKMFTFCTRTVYLGADFYSYCARSFIFSDSNSDCLAVDISEDLPQILGRQRLFENPWKNSATFYYRVTADYKKMNWEDFEKIIKKKQKSTEELIGIYDNTKDNSARFTLANTYLENTKAYNYKGNYVSVNKIINDTTGDVILKPVLNELVFVNELRAYKIQQIDYADRFAVFSTIHNKMTKDDMINQQALEFLEKYNSYGTMYEKLRLLCESVLSSRISKEVVEVILSQVPDSDEIKSYYTTLGPQRLYSLGYSITKIKKAMGIVVFSPELLMESIYSDFKEGDRISLSKIKSRLSLIYSSINYNSTPKANDLERWFEVKNIKVSEEDLKTGKKKQVRAYELLKSKEHELMEELKLIG